MIPDAECLKIMSEILTELQIGTFIIKVWGPVTCILYCIPVVQIETFII